MSIPDSRREQVGKRYPWMPDFFIVGAMKCGTTTLHHALAQHPDVYIPQPEIFFFDVDDFLQHPNFFPYEGGTWSDQDFKSDLNRNLSWYKRFFDNAKPDQLIGEDSTTYLASEKAAERIASFNPEAKILIMLRDPAERAYSAYWHLMRYGRVTLSFEDMLRLQPEPLMARSLYYPQLTHFIRVFGRANVHVEILEEYVLDPQASLRRVFRFLNLDDHSDEVMARQHSNSGGAPKYPWLARLRNRFLWRHFSNSALHHLSGMPVVKPSRFIRFLNKVHKRINPAVKRIPPMSVETRRFLNQYFRREGEGLEQLLGKDLNQHWYGSAHR